MLFILVIYLTRNILPMSNRVLSTPLTSTKTTGDIAISSCSRISQQPVHNRITAVLAHTTRYAFKGVRRLAQDCGASPSALHRVVNGQSSPSFCLVAAVTRALEKQTGKKLDPREIVSLDGTYPTTSVCELMGCHGCLPAEAYDADELLTSPYQQVTPGTWTGSVAPQRSVAPVRCHTGREAHE